MKTKKLNSRKKELDLSPVKETTDERKEFLKILNQVRSKMSTEEIYKGKLLQLKFKIEDYLESNKFYKTKRLGYFLRAYRDSLNLRDSQLATQIKISPSELSQYINNYRKPPVKILVRLELHSHKTIPANDWYKIVSRDELYDFQLNANSIRRNEKRNVKLAAI